MVIENKEYNIGQIYNEVLHTFICDYCHKLNYNSKVYFDINHKYYPVWKEKKRLFSKETYQYMTKEKKRVEYKFCYFSCKVCGSMTHVKDEFSEDDL